MITCIYSFRRLQDNCGKRPTVHVHVCANYVSNKRVQYYLHQLLTQSNHFTRGDKVALIQQKTNVFVYTCTVIFVRN